MAVLSRSWKLALAAGFAASVTASCPSHAAEDAATFHERVRKLYAFEPHEMTEKDIQAKSEELDAFWALMKADASLMPLLRAELARGDHQPTFFYYDGSKLLLSLSQERADKELALKAMPRASLKDVQHTDYLRTVHSLAARDGMDTTQAALKILDEPKFQAFIAQHALTLGQNYSLVYMLAPMEESRYVGILARRLVEEKDAEAQKTLALALWYTISPEGRAALESFAAMADRPEASRAYARSLLAKKADAAAWVTLSSADSLREQRRKVMSRPISDEALLEFDELTAKILAKAGR